jgi:hypothetical protein
MTKVPAGHRLYSRHVYYNPGTSPIFAGPDTEDEMLFDSFQYLDYLSGDETIDVENLLMSDTLLVAPSVPQSVREWPSADLQVSAYPNPCNNAITFTWNQSLRSATLQIFDITGAVVESVQIEGTSTYSFTYDSRKLPGGLYFYRLAVYESVTGGRFVRAMQ